jgi:hypothetical protein
MRSLAAAVLAAAPILCVAAEDAKTRNLVSESKQEQLAKDVRNTKQDEVPSTKLTAILRMMLAQEVRGTKRLGTEVPAGMPSGLVLPVNNAIAFDLREAVPEGFISLRIDGPGVRSVVSQSPPSGVLLMPAAPLTRAVDYQWTLLTRKGSYTAAFSLPDAATQQRVELRLTKVRGLAVDDLTRKVFEAAIYDDEDLDSARDLIVREVRQRLGP